MTLSTYLRGMTKNSSFLCFRAVFMSYCPQFWGSWLIYNVHDTQYQFKRHAKNSSFLCFRAIFVSYCPLFWGSVEIYKAHDTEYILERNGNFFFLFCDYGYFPELLPTILGFRGDLQGPWHLVHVWEAWPKLVIFAF
jgi:hypothetical protein